MPDRLGRAVNNLLDNAAKYSPAGGAVEVTLRGGGADGARPRARRARRPTLPHIFDRFFRATNARERPGSGLGLAIVEQVAERHGGSVAAAAAPGGGLAVTLAARARRSPGRRARRPIEPRDARRDRRGRRHDRRLPAVPAVFVHQPARRRAARWRPTRPRSCARSALDGSLKADFGSGLWEGGPIGIPYDVVARRTQRSRVRFEYAGESDRVRYPIPRGVQIEGGPDADGDRHALLVDRNRCKLFELYALRRQGGRWTAGSGATWSLRKPRLRPAGWTSADAAGLPILPLLARYQEVRRGRITHALRMTVSESRRAFVFPARHFASSRHRPGAAADGRAPAAEGAGVDISGLPRQARVVARAMKEYGLIVADNGSDWYVSGAPHPRWDNDQLHAAGPPARQRLRGRPRSSLRISKRNACVSYQHRVPCASQMKRQRIVS